MKILNAQQMKGADQATIKKEPISSIDLMERAAYRCFKYLEERIYEDKVIHVFCGMGNNGGDGLAITRFLFLEEYQVQTYIVHFSDNMSEDFVTNYKRAQELNIFPKSIHSEDDFPEIKKGDVVIDAIFGMGLSKAPFGFTKKLIKHINKADATTYSIDVPSGLFIDKPVEDSNAVVKSTRTLTFQTPKLALLLPDNEAYLQGFDLVDIGLNKEFIEAVDTNYFYVKNRDIRKIYKERSTYSHKGTFGHSLLIGGSFGKIGACVLAAKAAMKVGSGLVTAYVPKCGYTILQIAIPEVMVEVDAEDSLDFFNFEVVPDVIGLGMGMGTSDKTAKALGKFLESNKIPLVIDADGLNIIAKNKDYLNFLPKNTILTPHPKELERLIGGWKNDYEKLDKIKKFSKKNQCIVVVKGAHTVVVQNEKCFFNSTGNPALATAGTGDVLTGMITGLLAQKYTPLEAAIFGVFLHGRTADYAELLNNNHESFMASDIFYYLTDAYNSIFENDEDDYEDEDAKSDDAFPDDFFFDDDFDAPF